MDAREQLLDDIARCFAHAAVDALLLEMKQIQNGESRDPGKGAAFLNGNDRNGNDDPDHTHSWAPSATVSMR